MEGADTSPVCLWEGKEPEFIPGGKSQTPELGTTVISSAQSCVGKRRVNTALEGDCIPGDCRAPWECGSAEGGGEADGKCLESWSLLLCALMCECPELPWAEPPPAKSALCSQSIPAMAVPAPAWLPAQLLTASVLCFSLCWHPLFLPA